MPEKEKSSHKKHETNINIRLIAFIVAPFLILAIAVTTIIYYYLPSIYASSSLVPTAGSGAGSASSSITQQPSAQLAGSPNLPPAQQEGLTKYNTNIDKIRDSITEGSSLSSNVLTWTFGDYLTGNNPLVQMQGLSGNTEIYIQDAKDGLLKMAQAGYPEDMWKTDYQGLLAQTDAFNKVVDKFNSGLTSNNSFINGLGTVLTNYQVPKVDFGGSIDYKKASTDQTYVNTSMQNNNNTVQQQSNQIQQQLGTAQTGSQAQNAKGKINCDTECAQGANALQKAAIYLGGANFGAPVCALVCTITNGVIDIFNFINDLLMTSTI